MEKKSPVQHVWTVICNRSSIDTDSNNVSLFDLIEKLSITVSKKEWQEMKDKGGRGIFLQYDFEIVSRFYVPSKGVKAFDLRVRLLNPEGSEIASSGQKIALKEGIKNLRVRTKFSTIPIEMTGDCWLIVETKDVEEQEYSEAQRIPLETVIDLTD